MIKINASVPFLIWRSHDSNLWGPMLDQRRYVVETPFEQYLVDCDGLRAVLALIPGMDRSTLTELDASVNDILDATVDELEVEITLGFKSTRYSLISGKRRIIESTEIYRDVTRFLEEIAYQKAQIESDS